jgi:hypothetical protein
MKSFALCSLMVVICVIATSHAAEAQITGPQVLSSAPRKTASLEEILVNRLRATSEDQRAYVREIVKLVDQGKLSRKLILALQRYAVGKNPYFALPIFERVVRVEAAKRRVAVPTIREIVARNGQSAARAISDSRRRF